LHKGKYEQNPWDFDFFIITQLVPVKEGCGLFTREFISKALSLSPSPSRGEVTPPPLAPPLKIRGGGGSYDWEGFTRLWRRRSRPGMKGKVM